MTIDYAAAQARADAQWPGKFKWLALVGLAVGAGVGFEAVLQNTAVASGIAPAAGALALPLPAPSPFPAAGLP